MARRPDGGSRFDLSPGGRRMAGWLAAMLIVVAIAIGVGLLGANAGGPAAAPSVSASPAPRDAAAIRFGTALDPATGEVATEAETRRFVEADVFAYSYRPPDPPPPTVWVEVRRGADGSGEQVQPPAPHRLADDALVIAFSVPAANLFAAFESAGPYQMRIYLDADADPVAVGSFELVATASPSG